MEELTMKRRFFLKNLGGFLILLFIPVILMGSLSIYLLREHIKKNLDNEIPVLLKQMESKVDLLTDELDPLIYSLDIDGQTSYVAKKLLDSVEMTYTDIFLLKNFSDQLSSIRNARDYVHSIYIYFSNDHGYYLSDTGKRTLVQEDQFWFNTYLEHKGQYGSWSSLTPLILPDGKSQQFISFFHLLANGDGVIVINLLPQQLERMVTEGLGSGGHTLAVMNGKKELLMGQFPIELPAGTIVGGNTPLPKILLKNYITHFSHSEKTGWEFYLFSNKKVIFRVYRNLLKLNIILLVFTLVAGIVISVVTTSRRTQQVYRIINILKAAENHEPLVEITHKDASTFDYIIQKIINSFLQQSYLKAQLDARKYKLKTAQLMALQTQLNPHFLFNTLETINWKVYQLTNQPNMVNRMIENLSDLMRYSLSPPEEPVTLEDEIDHIQAYLFIQTCRYKDKFSVGFNTSEESLGMLVPRLLLQPLIENALYHGIRPLDRKGTITVESLITEGQLVIRIMDDGVGMDVPTLENLNRILQDQDDFRDTHIGLHNVNTRLILKYGSPLVVQSSLVSGTTVTITIPKEESEI